MHFLRVITPFTPRLMKPKFPTCNCQRGYAKIKNDCEKKNNCWNCKEAVDCTKHFFCDNCDHIQPLSEQNFFEYMGMKTAFSVDDQDLKKRFRDLQFKLHPDKFAQATTMEQTISDEHSRKLNNAYKTLSEPLSRARYLLKILGEESNADLSPEDLLEMMDWNERVAGMDRTELEEEERVVQKNILQCLSDLREAFAKKEMNEVKSKVTSLSYLYSLRRSISDKLGVQ